MRAGKEGGEEGWMVKGRVSEMACCQLSTPEEHGDGICKEPGVVHSPHECLPMTTIWGKVHTELTPKVARRNFKTQMVAKVIFR